MQKYAKAANELWKLIYAKDIVIVRGGKQLSRRNISGA